MTDFHLGLMIGFVAGAFSMCVAIMILSAWINKRMEHNAKLKPQDWSRNAP